MCRYRLMNAPGCSGIVTEISVSEVSARSETKRRRSKSMLAPLATATKVWPFAPVFCAYCFIPATASAPAGSSSTRVSRKESLIAAQISSVETVTISSTHIWHRRKVSSPTFRTAAPSAKRPTAGSSSTFPALRLSVMAAESLASTPITLMPGLKDLRNMPTPARSPPPPTQQKTASKFSPVVCARISWPMVPWPAMTCTSLKGWMSSRPSAFMHSTVAAYASS
mmetsp:Transcript_69706/g.179717  ORF Transcript_69706/g.179717 Transcript_69706/m.179717 type:complete len:224 (-) Transcript_69706:603-1274(-)